MTLFRCIAILAIVGCLSTAVPLSAQTTTSFTLPTYIGAGAAFNPQGDTRVTLFATAIYPLASEAGVYTSTTADITPVRLLNAKNQTYTSFQTSVRQGVHKIVYHKGPLMALLGGGAGGAFTQASPGGLNVNLAGEVTATVAWQFSKSLALIVPVRGLFTPQVGWALTPQVGIVFKP